MNRNRIALAAVSALVLTPTGFAVAASNTSSAPVRSPGTRSNPVTTTGGESACGAG